MKFLIPKPLKAEYAELRAERVGTARPGGRAGEAAKARAKLLHPHFTREEKFAPPPLGFLATLTQRAIDPEMTDILRLTDQPRAERFDLNQCRCEGTW